MQKGIDDVLKNNPDQKVIDRLQRMVVMLPKHPFGAITPTLGSKNLVLVFTDGIVINKAKYNRLKEFFQLFPKEKQSTGEIIDEIVKGEIAYFYGFSEILGKILVAANGSLKAFGAITPTLGSKNLVLVFTDGIVINKAKYNMATKEKKKVIQQFVQFYTSEFLVYSVKTSCFFLPPGVFTPFSLHDAAPTNFIYTSPLRLLALREL